MDMAGTIRNKLETALEPGRLDVIDESHLHAGHAGARPGGETHYRVEVVSARFQGLGRVDRQRLVYEALRQELADRVHALALKTLTPEEDAGG